MLIVGSIPYENEKDINEHIKDLKTEYGSDLKIWLENKLIMYKQYFKLDY